MARFTLSSLTFADASGRCRLHTYSYTLLCRAFSLLLLVGAGQVIAQEITAEHGHSFGKCSLIATALLALAAFVWFRPKRVVATEAGLEVGSGKKLRVIPWARVLDVRELPWHRLSPQWFSAMWQVDLDHDERFDFCGTLEAREIVRKYIARADSAQAITP